MSARKMISRRCGHTLKMAAPGSILNDEEDARPAAHHNQHCDLSFMDGPRRADAPRPILPQSKSGEQKVHAMDAFNRRR
jgi:hypothetical protein